MTISLSSGLSIRISNDQFLVPYVFVYYSGKRYTNDDKIDLLWNSISGQQPATLGRYFLTAAYYMVNHDSNSFTLWEANPTTSSNLVPVMNEETAEDCGNEGGVVQTSLTGYATPTGTESSLLGTSASPGSTRVPAIAGGVVGGAALLAITGLGAFFLFRRRQRALSQEASTALRADDDPATSGYQLVLKTHGAGLHELGGEHKPEAHELPLDDGPREIGEGEVIYATQEGDGVVHEMDGRVYTFSAEG